MPLIHDIAITLNRGLLPEQKRKEQDIEAQSEKALPGRISKRFSLLFVLTA